MNVMDDNKSNHLFRCERCDHPTNTKSNLLQHLRKKKPCKTLHSKRERNVIINELLIPPEEENNNKKFKCEYCNKGLSSAPGKSQHKKICPKRPELIMETTLKNLQLEVNKHKDEINTLRQQLQTKNNLETEIENTPESVSFAHQESVGKIKKKTKIPQPLRILCWNTYIGEEVGKTKCPCCEIIYITPFTFNCGHVIADSRGGKTTIDNLRPICTGCNNSMGTKNMEDFKKEFFN